MEERRFAGRRGPGRHLHRSARGRGRRLSSSAGSRSSDAPLEVWVTGGGTREPIDDVRYVGNRSTGRLAVAVAGAALEAGYRVRSLLAADVTAPSKCPRGTVERFESADDLLELLLAEPGPDALIHAAAVADYAPVRVEGKVPSGRDRWTLEMVRSPKLADRFRLAHPESSLTMFKLESRVSQEELFERARAAGRRVGADQVFANLLHEVEGARHAGWLLSLESDRVERVEGRDEIARALVRSLRGLCREGRPGGAANRDGSS